MEQSVLKRLASIAFAVSCGTLEPAAALAELPAGLVIESVEDVDADRDRWKPDDLRALLQLVSHDPRVPVRERVAEVAGSLWHAASPGAAQQVLSTLSEDVSSRVRAAAGRGLMRVLEQSSPQERIELVSAWATDDDPHRRAAIAYALSAALPLFITDLAIEELSGDADPEVRAAALAAAATHFDEAPRVYARIAEARLDDADPRVRYAARRLLMRR
jgi:HEAT repeat protein